MFKITDKPNCITFTLSSSWKNIGNSVLELNRFFSRFDVTEDYLAKTKVVLRELLVNAVRHGNCSDMNKMVIVKTELLNDQNIRISVEDEGRGFDYRQLAPSIPDDPKKIKQRGYSLVYSLVEKLEFNQSGNCVTAHLSKN